MTRPKQVEKRLKMALHGVAFSESCRPLDIQQHLHLHQELSRPPSYLVRIALRTVEGMQFFHDTDKSAWQTGLRFSGFDWWLEDSRRISWRLWGPPSEEEKATTLVKKLRGAAKILDSALGQMGRKLVSDDRCALQNNYQRADALYDFHRAQAEQLLEQPAQSTAASPDVAFSVATMLNEQIEREQKLEAYCLAAVMFFFAMTEVLLDCCFALGDRKGLSFLEFRRLDWGERFRFFFDIGGGDGQAVYERARRIRQEHRNAWAHADPVLFVPWPEIGLIPVTYEDLDKPRMRLFSSIDQSEAQQILSACVDLLSFIKNEQELGRFAFEYARSGLPIIIDAAEIEKLTAHTRSIEEFACELEARCRYQDDVDNMEI